MPDLERDIRLGQVWTPNAIALKMVRMAMRHFHGAKPISILDPSVGPFTFPHAFINAGLVNRIQALTMFDVDPRMVKASRELCPSNKGWNVIEQDYLRSEQTEEFDLAIMNPPYVRQELIPKSDKEFYYKMLEAEYGTSINKRSNLFALFLLKALTNVREGGIVCAIVYDVILSSRYGKRALELMEKRSTLISSEHVLGPFGDALIDAQIMIWKKKPIEAICPEKQDSQTPNVNTDGFKQLSELMSITRGFSVPYRKAFIVPHGERVPFKTREIFIKQRDPNIFSCETTSRILSDLSDARAMQYIQQRLDGDADVSNIRLSNREKIGDICFNYYLRDKPRHLINLRGVQVSDNYYVCTVLNGFPVKAAWVLLNSNLYLDAILSCGRNQGDGLMKLQAYEYKSAIVPDWGRLLGNQRDYLISVADDLIKTKPAYEVFRKTATLAAKEVLR